MRWSCVIFEDILAIGTRYRIHIEGGDPCFVSVATQNAAVSTVIGATYKYSQYDKLL